MIFKDKSVSLFNATLLSKGVKKVPKRIYIEHGVLPGMSRNIYEDTGEYEPYERQVEILFKDSDQKSIVDSWLTGEGRLSFEGDKGYFYARVLEVEHIDGMNKKWFKRIVKYEVEPFMFLYTGDTLMTVQSGDVIDNPGIDSDPYIKVTGNGPVTIKINGVDYPILLVNQFIEMEYPFAWKGTLPKGQTLTNGFPKLKSGTNVITWTGTVTKFEMKGRWRTL